MTTPSIRARYVAMAAVLGMLLSLPSLAVGFLADDYIHLMALEGVADLDLQPFDLYRFANGDPARAVAWVRHGPWPWWMDPSLKAAFWRPLASAMLQLDHALFGLEARGYHAHALLWYGALVVVVGLVYRRLLGHGVATLALFMFAIDEAHVFPTAWVASRYANMSALFALCALLWHMRAREEGGRFLSVAALGAYLTSLACGESGLATLAFLFTYEAMARDDARRRRLFALLPFALVTAAYLVAHRLLGYGVFGSAVYADPFHDPLTFLGEAPQRYAALSSGLFASMPVDMWLPLPQSRVLLVPVGALSLPLVVLLLRASLRSADPATRRTVSWLFAGALLSLVPGLGAPPGTRIAVLASAGAFPAIALIIRHGWQEWRARRRRLLGAGALWLATAHLFLAGPLMLGGYCFFALGAKQARTALAHFAPADPSGKVVVLRGSPFVALYGGAAVVIDRGLYPAAWNLVTLTDHPLRITRTSERGLDVEVLEGTLFDTPFEQVYRPDAPMALGYRVETASFVIEVTAVEHGRPTRLSVELADAEVFLHTAQGLETFTLPAIGAAVTLAKGPGDV